MPDENEKTEATDVPETSLHAHGSGMEEDEGRREEDAQGQVHEGEQDASQVPDTGGSTSGGPPDADSGEDDADDA